MKKSSLLLLFLMLCFLKCQATHLMGGEITWHCQGNGTYIFKMKVYRDCLTAVYITNGGPISIRVHNHPSVYSIPMSIIDSTDVSPVCAPTGPTFNCMSPNGNVATMEYILESAPINLPGIPPAQGWIFSWSNCCRNASITNLNLSFTGPGNPINGMTLRAIMFPFNGQNAGNCYDAAPEFTERPFISACAGSTVVYNAGAYDPNGDSLALEFDYPLDYFASTDSFNLNSPLTIPFEQNYSFNAPFPGTIQNPNNVPAQLNQNTGELTFKCFNQGNYVNVIKATSYRCGQKVAEIYREIQSSILSCGANPPPDVVCNGINATLSNYTFVDTVLAGDIVNFSIKGIDNGYLPSFFPQTISINPIGSQFGLNFIDANSGCLNPPCATIGTNAPYNNTDSVSIDFSWQTACNHVIANPNCPVNSTTYKFLFNVKDDYCPTPAYKIITVMIVVKSISNNTPLITFDGAYLNSTAGLSYQWFLNGTLLPNDTTQSIIPLDSGSYTVQLTDTNLCTNTSLPNLVLSISQYDKDQKQHFEIFPNPANELFYIKGKERVVDIIAYTLAGHRINLFADENKVEIAHLASGFYIIEISSNSRKERMRLMKL